MVHKKTKLMLKTERIIGKPLEQAIPEAYEKWGTVEAAAKALDIPITTFRDVLITWISYYSPTGKIG